LGDTNTALVDPEIGQAREAFTSFEENDIQSIFLIITPLTRMIYSKVIIYEYLINPTKTMPISFSRITENDYVD